MRDPQHLRYFVRTLCDGKLSFSVIDEDGVRRFFNVSNRGVSRLYDLLASCATLDIIEYFPEKDLRCQELLIDDCISPELDPRQKPTRDMPDTTKAIAKTPHDGEDQFKRDIGESLL